MSLEKNPSLKCFKKNKIHLAVGGKNNVYRHFHCSYMNLHRKSSKLWNREAAFLTLGELGAQPVGRAHALTCVKPWVYFPESKCGFLTN